MVQIIPLQLVVVIVQLFQQLHQQVVVEEHNKNPLVLLLFLLALEDQVVVGLKLVEVVQLEMPLLQIHLKATMVVTEEAVLAVVAVEQLLMEQLRLGQELQALEVQVHQTQF